MKRRSLKVKDYELLAKIANAKGFGPVRLAAYCRHDSHSYMSRVLRGDPKARYVSVETARYIAEAFEVPIDLLFEERQVQSADLTRRAA